MSDGVVRLLDGNTFHDVASGSSVDSGAVPAGGNTLDRSSAQGNPDLVQAVVLANETGLVRPQR
ncbi:hypothetical protein ACFT9M_07575 [Micromonospora purpureochromogenes]|uniref:hypothetical protein n=1 Tax=Micromonospora purpureochromogenes TaxID=47872 RepID=UPI00362D8C97